MQFGADFSALIGRFCQSSDQVVALAVSGGSDSLALLHLTHFWAQQMRRKLVVFTVDHRLRAAAQQEAQHVAAHCASLGHRHQTLVWDQPKASQGEARAARYKLLSKAAHAAGAAVLLTGHTLDDVVETALIRRRRGVRDATLAGPVLAAPVPAWPAGRGLTLLRPLVQVRRAALRDWLKARAQTWIEDPSNTNPSYERARVRAALSRHPGLTRMATDFTQSLQIQRADLDADFAQDLRRVRVSPDGLIMTAEARLSNRLLAVLARCASGGDRDPRAMAVTEMRQRLRQAGARQTLGGAWFQTSLSGFAIGRDPAPPQKSSCGRIFDGRFAEAREAAQIDAGTAGFLVRHALPPGAGWEQIISQRIDHLAQCAETPFYTPVDPDPQHY